MSNENIISPTLYSTMEYNMTTPSSTSPNINYYNYHTLASYMNTQSDYMNTPSGYMNTPSSYMNTPSGYMNTPSGYMNTPSGYTGINYSYHYNYTPSGYTGTCSDYIPSINSYIPHIGFKTIPKNSSDVITFEDIQNGDILIDFKRDSIKSEYDCNTFYKESTLKFILETNKNQFTMEPIDKDSIVKYTAIIE